MGVGEIVMLLMMMLMLLLMMMVAGSRAVGHTSELIE